MNENYIELTEEFESDDIEFLLSRIPSYPEFVLIGGQGRVGKTTTAHALARCLIDHGFTPKVFSFSNPIKEELAALGIDKNNPNYRNSAICVGAAARAQDPDHYVKKASAAAVDFINHSKELGRNPIVIFDDLRYLNEFRVASPDRVLTVMLAPIWQKDMIEWNADWRTDVSETLGRIQGPSDADPFALEDLEFGANEHMKLEDVVKTHMDIYAYLVHHKDWESIHKDVVGRLTDIIVTLRARRKDPPNGDEKKESIH